MKIKTRGEIWYWRGPSPFHFITISKSQSEKIRELSSQLSYGWGCIPVKAKIGQTDFTTAIIPKDEKYLIPIKTTVRNNECLEIGDITTVSLYFELK